MLIAGGSLDMVLQIFYIGERRHASRVLHYCKLQGSTAGFIGNAHHKSGARRATRMYRDWKGYIDKARVLQVLQQIWVIV